MFRKLLRIIHAIDDCIGMEIPYPLAKKMVELCRELESYLEQQASKKGGKNETMGKKNEN